MGWPDSRALTGGDELEGKRLTFLPNSSLCSALLCFALNKLSNSWVLMDILLLNVSINATFVITIY
jgi:hypothetical protein